MSEMVDWLNNQNIDSCDVIENDIDGTFASLADKPRCDVIVYWDKPNRKKFKFKVLNTVWVDDKEFEEADGLYQFIIIKSSKSIEQSRIYRRGSVMGYCRSVRKGPGPGKVKDDKVNITWMKNYITLEEFPAMFSKLKLAGLEFTNEEFWKSLKFPRKD